MSTVRGQGARRPGHGTDDEGQHPEPRPPTGKARPAPAPASVTTRYSPQGLVLLQDTVLPTHGERLVPSGKDKGRVRMSSCRAGVGLH